MLKARFRQAQDDHAAWHGLPARAGAVLLEWAIRIAPPDERIWGLAMQGELNQVEGAWAALMWALGGAGVLVRRALVSLFSPGRRGRSPLDGGLFAKRVSLRGAALAAGGGCVLGALLFLAAPPFRQAFRVSMRPWTLAFQAASGNLQPSLEALLRRAQQNRDAEGLAFCAVRLQDYRASASAADEAIGLSPDLFWVYGVVAMRHPGVAEVSRWLERLEQQDPQNALLYLIEAERTEGTHFRHGEWTPPSEEQNQAWQTAMGAAFRSPKFDDYLDRLAGLNRTVVSRYRFYDPDEIESRSQLEFLPVFVFEDSERFANSVLHAAAELEAHGDRKGAREKYWMVARFGQVIDSQGHTGFEHWAGTSLQAMAYKPLQALSKKDGNTAEAEFFGYLARKFDGVSGQHPDMTGQQVFGTNITSRNAAVLMISGVMMLVCSVSAIVAAAVSIFGRRRGRTDAQRARPVATVTVLASAVGLLLSSATLYLTYRPYWYIYQGVVQNGGRSQSRDLHDLLMATQVPPGIASQAYLSLIRLLPSWWPYLQFYFWTALILLVAAGIILTLQRHFGEHSPDGDSPRSSCAP
jgi:hypothetical protein